MRRPSARRTTTVAERGRPALTPKKIAGESIPALLELLKEPEDNVRERAKIDMTTMVGLCRIMVSPLQSPVTLDILAIAQTDNRNHACNNKFSLP